MTPTPNPQPQPTNPPAISVYCYNGSGYYEAYASNGTGSGYNFNWGSAYEQYNADGYSWASVDCYSGYVYVIASVTDSSGASASSGAYYYCGDGREIQPLM